MFPHIRCALWLWVNFFIMVQCFPTIDQAHLQKAGNYVTQNLIKEPFVSPPELEDTIEEVQKILAQDQSLPRLTRGEIEELYEKVTREEYEKSLQSGDMGRADSMRALMLVLPFNTDNNTEENLQDLYTRQPITQVIDVYKPPQFNTTDSSSEGNTEIVPTVELSTTSFKPGFKKSYGIASNPTHFNPQIPIKMLKKPTTPAFPEPETGFRPITTTMPVYNFALDAAHVAQTVKPNQRFSSHYSAKNADFLKPPSRPKVTTSTVKAMADVLESYGIVGQAQLKNRVAMDDYFAAESAPQGVISTYVPQIAHLPQFQQMPEQSWAPKIRPDAYSNFKPLNIGEEIRVKPEIEGYLTRFGIVANRKRKELNKEDQDKIKDDTELYLTQGNDGTKRARKGVASSPNSQSSQLEELLKNLQELERLNKSPKKPTTTTTSSTVRITTTKATTTTTTTPKPTTTTVRDLITNGAPLLIEAKAPQRRIDPNLDLNFGAANNKQVQTNNNAQQLEKLLQNLQELQKLRINPENVLKAVIPRTMKPMTTTTVKPITTTTAKPSQTTAAMRAQSILNRVIDPSYQLQQHASRQINSMQLEEVLKQLQAAERSRTSSTTTTTTTTKKPIQSNGLALNDLSELRRLLGNDSELERLYNQVRERGPPTKAPATTTTTTQKPAIADFEELQKYLSLFDRTTTKPTTTSTTTASTTTTTTPKPTTTTTTTTTTPKPTTTTTTTTTTPKPAPSTTAEPNIRKPVVGNEQILELINRVQELERAHAKKQEPTHTSAMPFLGFTSRNVNAPNTLDNDQYYGSTNELSQLQQLYKNAEQVEEDVALGAVEISTASSTSKIYVPKIRSKQQEFAQRLIDLTNDTGSGSSLQAVEPNEFIHLQKLLNKVQELERIKIGPNGLVQTAKTSLADNKFKQETAPTLNTIATETVNVYAVPVKKKVDAENLEKVLSVDASPAPPALAKKHESEVNSSEELREFVMSPPTNRKDSKLDTDFEGYQDLFSSIENNERNSYQKLQPPLIQKTATKEPPRFIATRKPQDLPKTTTEKNDLKELQKLLSNAQELEKLGITLPTQLSKDIEHKLSQTQDLNVQEGFKNIQLPSPNQAKEENAEVEDDLDKYGIFDTKDDLKQKSTVSNEITTNSQDLKQSGAGDDDDTAFISLTTLRSVTPKAPKPTTESSLQLPVFSATKIIEAAIKRAANKIGVSTENTLGFRRRSDADLMDMDADDDLMAEFSELNYQMVAPDAPLVANHTTEQANGEKLDISEDLQQLQRLITNLKELQKLNISSSSEALRIADAAYLETLKKTQNEGEEIVMKNRRQSETTPQTNNDATTLKSPTRISLNLELDDSDAMSSAVKEQVSSTMSTTSVTEESSNAALSDLADSFGPDPNAEAERPPKKKNGFYFLADWNSFLEVGDGDDQVVVRLSPKIGDPRLFLPVKIP